MATFQRHTVCLLGGGPRGVDHGRAFLENADRFEMAGLCDRNPERLENLRAAFPDAPAFEDADRMLAEARPDVFCFATPPDIRLSLVELGARHSVKAIAFEKPMATSLAEARRIHEVCAGAGIKTIVSHQHKYGDHWRKAREIIAGGEIGEVHAIHATSKGWLLQYATHLLDYMMFLNGGARVSWIVGHVQGRGKLADSHPSPDYALGRMAFENGVEGVIECGDLAPDLPGENPFWLNAGATVYGSHGYAQVIVGSGWRATTKTSGGMIQGSGAFNVAHDQAPYIRDLADWLDDPGKPHPCHGDVAYHGFQVAMGLCLSALEKRKVELPLAADTPICERLAEAL